MKNFTQHNYRGNFAIPKADVLFDKDLKLITIGFSWGEINPFQEVSETISNYFSASKNDFESTSPFDKIPSLSPLTNIMRTSLLISNEKIYRAHNKQSYVSGLELISIGISGHELVIGQIGSFSTVLINKAFDPIILTSSSGVVTNDLASQPPIPLNLMGTDNICYPQLTSVRFEPDDQLFVTAGPQFPTTFLNHNFKIKTDLSLLATELSNRNSQIPFWIGNCSL